MTPDHVHRAIAARWPECEISRTAAAAPITEVACPPDVTPALCGRLFLEWGFSFAALVVEEGTTGWELRYCFYGERAHGWVYVLVRAPLERRTFPSIVRYVHAANWHEREAEDLFGLTFEGHPHLGDFVLHDDAWQEGVEPMRHRFSAGTRVTERQPRPDWRPALILETPGAFAMPIGPVFAGGAESAHFLLETVGEDVVRAIPRLFYNYRGIEKIAEGRSITGALLLAERFAATTAFAHAVAFCQAVETVCVTDVPARARILRVFVAELERCRHHVGAAQDICESTALVVAASQAALLEEELLRISGRLTGHRYLFGLAVPGGLARDLDDDACGDALRACRACIDRLSALEQMLRFSGSFLDRLEQVGYIAERDARAFGLVGPIARASGVSRDLRATQPYGAYTALPLDVPVEREGDGYARLRILCAEARESVRLMQRCLDALSGGAVHVAVRSAGGAAMGWVEAPRGAAFHWIRLHDDGTIARYRLAPASFANWLGFRLGVENFAFQDFPIILSTLDLSVAENDR